MTLKDEMKEDPTTNTLNEAPSRRRHLEVILDNLTEVETSLLRVLRHHQGGEYGFVTREWGFTAPGGLGGKLGGKFRPWEEKLAHCKTFFWPMEAYESMEVGPDYGRPDPDIVAKLDLHPEGEQLYGNVRLHEFLREPPFEPVELESKDFESYRDASRLFLLLGTLVHLYGNSAVDRTNVELPEWLEDPFTVVARRLDVAPTLSGHFLVQENWVWKSAAIDNENVLRNDVSEIGQTSEALSTTSKSDEETGPRKHPTKETAQMIDQKIITVLLKECVCEDRRYRIKIYPNCFVGSQFVDVLMDNGYASTREDAVRVGRKLNMEYKLFSHVTNDHLLMDKYLFYRFRKTWRKHQQVLFQSEGDASMPLLFGDSADTDVKVNIEANSFDNADHDDDYRNEFPNEDDDCDGVHRSFWLLRPSDVLRRRSDSLVGSLRSAGGSRSSEAIGSVSGSGRRNQTIRERQSSSGSQNSSNNVLSHSDLTSSRKSVDAAARSRIHVSDDDTNNPPLSSSTLKASGLDHELVQLTSLKETMSTIACMAKVSVRDRRYRFRIYKQCFIGSELIDILMENECASTRKEALMMALAINNRFRLFEHVVDNHLLKDDYLFYSFTDAFRKMVDNPDSSIDGAVNGMTDSGGVQFNTQGATSNVHSTSLKFFDQNLISHEQTSSVESFRSFDSIVEAEDDEEFRYDNITLLYPAFGNSHERVNQLIPACMGNALAGLPFLVVDIISAMRNVLEAELNRNNGTTNVDDYESRHLFSLLYKVAFSLSKCKEEFQQMSTDPLKRTFNSKYVSIKQTQPLSNGVRTRREKGGDPLPSKGTTGTQFPYFHLLDWLLGRHQFSDGGEAGLVAQVGTVDETFPRPQREYIHSLSKLNKSATLRGFMEALGKPQDLLTAYNHVIECYGGEGGILQAHCRKLFSYIHNNVQFSTSGTNHLAASRKAGSSQENCPARRHSTSSDNHKFAMMMFRHMQKAAEDRYKLRLPPLFQEVRKAIYSTSESGGFATVALDLDNSGLLYEYGDVVKVILPNCEKTTLTWVNSLSSNNRAFFSLDDMMKLHKDTGNRWGWKELWEALGWYRFDDDGGVPLEMIARYIEQAQIRDESSDKTRWVHSPLDLGGKGSNKIFAQPPAITIDQVASLEPVAPRLYSVSGVESERVFLLVSKPQDGAYHHGYESMADPQIEKVHCAFSPATFFIVPPRDVNLVCVASGTGISPFVGLVDAIGSRQGAYTVVHQCKSSDLFLANSQTWLDFTAINPGAAVFGYISGDRSRRNCPMRYAIRNGAFEETTVLRRHNACAYYFECQLFQNHVNETYKNEGLNLAYCCGGVMSAIEPLQQYTDKMGMKFEFTCESYGVPPTLCKESNASTIGGTIVNLDHVGPIHPGGDQILHQLNGIVAEERNLVDDASGTSSSSPGFSIPDHSNAFFDLHPHAYNLHRCLRTPLDADFEAFVAFLKRQSIGKGVMTSMAVNYAQVALSSPGNSKIVKIATELQSSAIQEQMDSGDVEGARQSAAHLRALLKHVSEEDPDKQRWLKCLQKFSV